MHVRPGVYIVYRQKVRGQLVSGAQRRRGYFLSCDMDDDGFVLPYDEGNERVFYFSFDRAVGML